MENSLAIEGRATFIEEPMKGVRKDPEVVITKAVVLFIRFSIFLF
jgi:hypothetical protein